MSRKRRDLARIIALASITFALVMVLELCGWLKAGDDILHALYFRWGPERQSAHRVLVLTVDDSNAPNWSPSKVRAALDSVMQGNPSVVALIDPEETFGLSPSQVRNIVQDPRNHDRVLAARSDTFSLGGATGITTIDSNLEVSKQARLNALDAVSSHIAQPRLDFRSFPVNYLKSRETLPKIPFWTQLSSKSQRSSFRGNVILIGPTSGPKADLRNTPIGPMSSLEIHAHAISGLIDRPTWETPTAFQSRAFLFLLLLAWSYRLSRHTRPGLIREGTSLGMVCLLGDWLLFHKGIMIWGPTASILGIWVAQFLAVRASLLNVTNKVGYLQTRLAEMLPEAVAEKKDAKDLQVDSAFWQDLVDFGRGYLQLDFEGMIAELPEKEWHIQFRASTGSSTQDIAEQRRDIRRAPFRSPFLTQRCGWARNFVRNRDFPKTLVIPLHHHSKLYGYWLLHMREKQELDEAFFRTCEALGQQMASVIAEHRGQQDANEDELANRAQLAVHEVERDVQRLEKERSWAMQVIEKDPNPMMMASLWGPIELMNERMRERVHLLFPHGIPDNDIRAVVAKLCGGTQAQVQTLMRSVVVDQGNVPVPQAPDEQVTFVQGDYAYFLRSIEVGGSQQQQQQRNVPDINQVRILLVAKDRHDAPRVIEPIQALPELNRTIQTDEPSANDCDPKTLRIPAPEPFPDQGEPVESSLKSVTNAAEALDMESQYDPSVYYEDGWEDWTPEIELDPRDDIALSPERRAAS